jgi:hypothetical protein
MYPKETAVTPDSLNSVKNPFFPLSLLTVCRTGPYFPVQATSARLVLYMARSGRPREVFAAERLAYLATR